MKKIHFLVLALSLSASSPVWASSDLENRIIDATNILARRQGSDDPIPTSFFLNARGIAIGTVTKAGLGLGGQVGGGIVVVNRGSKGAPIWSAPSAWDLTAGSVGAQIGYAQIHVIKVLSEDYQVRRFTLPGRTEYNIGTYSGTAGDNSTIASKKNRSLDSVSIVTFQESIGLFGGLMLEINSSYLNDEVNHAAYGPRICIRDILSGRVSPPESAHRLYQLLVGQR